MKSDLYATIMEAVSGDLSSAIPSWHQDRAAVGVVMTSGGYPGSYKKGFHITGTEKFKVTIEGNHFGEWRNYPLKAGLQFLVSVFFLSKPIRNITIQWMVLYPGTI